MLCHGTKESDLMRTDRSIRQEKVNQEVLRALEAIIAEDVKDKRVNCFVQVTECCINKDFSFCKVYVNIEDKEVDKKSVIDALNDAKNFIKFELYQRTNLKRTPELRFYYDDSKDKLDRIEEILKSINEHDKKIAN